MNTKKKYLLHFIFLSALGFSLVFYGCGHSSSPTPPPVEDPYLTHAKLTSQLTTLATMGGAWGGYIGAVVTEIGDTVLSLSSGTTLPVQKGVIHYQWPDPEGGTDRTLSALTLAPRPASGILSVPVIAYQHGTQVYRSCEPSSFGQSLLAVLSNPETGGSIQNYLEGVIGAYIATTGALVVMPDYPGFGSDTGMHPYIHQSLGESVRLAIDSAIQKLENGDFGSRLQWNGQVFLIGYSEGGYATMSAARAIQLYKDANPESWTATAAIAMAGPHDLSTVGRQSFVSTAFYPAPHYYAFALVSWNRIETPDDNELFNLLKEEYRTETFENLFNGRKSTIEILEAMGFPATPAALLDSAGIDAFADPGDPDWLGTILEKNDTWRGWTPGFPVKLFHCTEDEIVPFTHSQNAATRMASPHVQAPAAVVPLDLPELSVGVHTLGFVPAMRSGIEAIFDLY